jgi:hypothetical protein
VGSFKSAVCFALLCFALLCFALLCFALLCFALRRARRFTPTPPFMRVTQRLLLQLEPSSTRVMFMDLMLPGPYNQVQCKPLNRSVLLIHAPFMPAFFNSNTATRF